MLSAGLSLELIECKVVPTDGVARQHRDREILVQGATSLCWPSL
jgi:hypothetical protein